MADTNAELAARLREAVEDAEFGSGPVVRLSRGMVGRVIAALEATEGKAEHEPVEFALDGTWVVVNVNQHTCGTGPDGHFGVHEPGCGQEPVVDLATLSGFAALRADCTGKHYGDRP